MFLLPLRKYTIESAMKRNDLAYELMKNVDTERPLKFWKKKSSSCAFEGKVGNNKFEIKRVISYQNSFAPVIKGVMEDAGEKTTIRVDIGMHPKVMLFMVFWLAFVGLGLVLALNEPGNDYNSPSVQTTFTMLALGVVMPLGAFLFEERKARIELLRVTNGRMV